MSFYRAKIQMAVLAHGGERAIVEAEIELPDFYKPQIGSWLDHSYLDGSTPVVLVGYDCHIGRPIITLGGVATDASCNLAEWLANHTHWKVATKPTLGITPQGLVVRRPGPASDIPLDDPPQAAPPTDPPHSPPVDDGDGPPEFSQN